MQKELDELMNEWTLEKDYPALKQGYFGAIQKEVLYMFNPASFILRKALRPDTLVNSEGPSSPIHLCSSITLQPPVIREIGTTLKFRPRGALRYQNHRLCILTTRDGLK